LSSAEILLDAGADIDAADFGGNTALMGFALRAIFQLQTYLYPGAQN